MKPFKTSIFLMMWLMLPVSICLIGYSCSNDEKLPSNFEVVTEPEDKPEVETNSLKGTKWKLSGIVDAQTGDMKVLAPADCDRFYYFQFATETEAIGYSITGRLYVNLEKSPYIDQSGKCDWSIGDAQLFYDVIRTVDSYGLRNDSLMFYFNNNENYLLFKWVDEPEPNSLKGTRWKLSGIVDVQTGDIKILEPTDCECCYSFVFVNDTVAEGRSIGNHLFVYIDKPGIIIDTKAGEPYLQFPDVLLFYDAIKKIDSYSIKNDSLMFYFNDNKNYLSFKQL